MTTKHTPGPWLYIEGTPFIGTDEADPQTVAYTDDRRNRFPRRRAEHEANARLIAASPELLEALEAIKARIEGEWDNPALVKYGPLMTTAGAS